MTLIIDASIACKWFFPEAGSADAEAVAKSGETLWAPDIVVTEVANVAWRKVTRGEIALRDAKAVLEDLPNIFDHLVPATELAVRALEIAAGINHPIYDCLYLALAERQGAEMVTADRRLIAKLSGTPWARTARGFA